MKRFMKIFSALISVFVLSSVVYAATPSVTMLSTGTCPACRQMSKVLDEINSKYKNKISTSTVNLEKHPETAKEYNVRFVPMLIFKDSAGKEISRVIGYISLDEVLNVFHDAGVKI